MEFFIPGSKFFTRLFSVTLSEAAVRGVFYKKFLLKNFAKLTGKYLCQSLISNKVAGLVKLNLKGLIEFIQKMVWSIGFGVTVREY